MKVYTLCIVLLVIILLLVQYSDEKKRKHGKHSKGRGSKGSRESGRGDSSRRSGSKQRSRERSREYWVIGARGHSREDGSRRYSKEGPSGDSSESSRRYSKERSRDSSNESSGSGGKSGSREHGLLPPDSSEVCPEIKHYCEPKTRIWLIGVTRLVSPVVLVDASGRLVGFGLDLVDAVCKMAGKSCRVIKVPPEYCSQIINGYFFAGDALIYGVLDGCLHQQVIVNRFDVADFTLPYADPTTSLFHVRPKDVHQFHITRLDRKVIAYLKATSADEDCILRNGIKGAVLIGYSSYQDAVRDVLTKKVFAFFSYRTAYAGLSAVSRYTIQCNRGWAIMTRPGNSLVMWWDDAYSELKATPKYRSICLSARTKYGASMQCSTNALQPNSTVTQQQADTRLPNAQHRRRPGKHPRG